jgi:Uma2 family endonuclease
MTTSETQMTLEAFLTLPDEKPTLEFQAGAILQKPACGARHSMLQVTLMTQMARSAEPRKLAMVFPELRVNFGGNSYVPDVAAYRWERVPVDANGDISDVDMFDPPDIAVEIGGAEHDLESLFLRCVWYVDNGVRIAVLVDPADESIAQFRPGQPPAILRGADLIDLSEVLDDFALTVQDLFDSLRIR